jgi:FKBP-type peptidyl-prolyl cis-trans isomerase FklB
MKVSGAGVIPAFKEILPMMKVGSKWRLVIPPEMAYQVRGQGPIGPNETLVFEIEIKEKVKTPESTPK